MSARKFFISYRRERDSSELAQFLRHELESAGHEVFIDVDMPVGTDWSAEIKSGIGWCDYLIVLLSDGARMSEMVQSEVRLAHRRRMRDGTLGIFPIRMRCEGTLDYELDNYLGRIPSARWWTQDDSPVVLQWILTSAAHPTVVRDHAPAIAAGAPGGSLSSDDSFYVERGADAEVMAAARAQFGTTVVIKGPRQTGKSLLLNRYLAEARTLGQEVCLFDLTEASDSELAEYSGFLGTLADHFARTFEVEPLSTPPLLQRHVTKYFEQKILARKPGPIVLAFDDVDRLLGRPYQDEFFAMIRLWHNKRAELRGWQRVSIALVHSTEPYLLMERDDDAPFNVSVPVVPQMFSLEDCRRLNEQYGTPLDAREVEELYELVCGHPYLTRLAFYHLTTPPPPAFRSFLEHMADPDGPFGDHLRALLMKLTQQPVLLEALSRLIRNGTPPSREAANRLSGAGLIVRSDGAWRPANGVYARFFKSVRT